jgi:hypothetical protein
MNREDSYQNNLKNSITGEQYREEAVRGQSKFSLFLAQPVRSIQIGFSSLIWENLFA